MSTLRYALFDDQRGRPLGRPTRDTITIYLHHHARTKTATKVRGVCAPTRIRETRV